VSHIDGPKISVESGAEQTMQAILHDRPEVLADERSVKAALSQAQGVDAAGAVTR
jgi:hypothetical protein